MSLSPAATGDVKPAASGTPTGCRAGTGRWGR